jgi:SAM-dependent methyltransferase
VVRRVLSSDESFDDELPLGLQLKSSVFFTPIDVARHAAALLAPEQGMRVLDIGAGAGKFCLAAALAIPSAAFVGVEWRGHLVRLANRLAGKLQLANARFIHADALDLDWTEYDAFYLYNPFAEQLFEAAFTLDRTIALDPQNFVHYVSEVRQRLALARVGTRVVTYHGYGAPAPLGYELARKDPAGSDCVELWIKTRAITSDEAAEDAVA